MISISAQRDKCGWRMCVTVDSGNGNPREILSGGAESPREAALWLLRKVNKLADEVEDQLVDLGFLTEADCEAALAEEDRVP